MEGTEDCRAFGLADSLPPGNSVNANRKLLTSSRDFCCLPSRNLFIQHTKECRSRAENNSQRDTDGGAKCRDTRTLPRPMARVKADNELVCAAEDGARIDVM